VPELPRYTKDLDSHDDRAACIQRLRNEQKASIIGSNPPLATGLIANQIVLQLLSLHGHARDIPPLPRAPGYVYLDSAHLCMKQVVMEDDNASRSE
jgi:hypothetical protein